SQSVMNARMANIFKSEVSSTFPIKHRYTQPERCNPTKLIDLEQRISNWLGEGTKLAYNNSKDPIFMSQDGLRKIRFDFLNPHGDVPHLHMEHKINRRWKDAGSQHRIYPKND
ncbi:MAG: hypothetical protein ACOYK9_05740, partial [Chlamydiia bacterium]